MEAIRTKGLGKRFGKTAALDDLDLTVEPGEVFGFLGPNGAGKSTTIRLLLGLIRPTSGQAWIFGDAAAKVTVAHKHVAYVPAEVSLWPQLTGAETLELMGRVGPGIDVEYRTELVRRFQLDLDKPTRSYSTGNRQKVALIAAFATRAKLLILDEPTSGLDPLMEREFRACVKEAARRKQTVFLSSHQLAEVDAVCHRVGILREGKLVEVADLDDLRQLRRRQVELTFEEAPPDLSGVDGVSDVRVTLPNRVRLSLTGPPGPALRAIAAAEVTSIDVREPTLEEIFLEYYGGDGAAVAKPGGKPDRKARRMGFMLPGRKGDGTGTERDAEKAGETA